MGERKRETLSLPTGHPRSSQQATVCCQDILAGR
ncbi:hypothetical protein A2U01_0114142, partial [Trifolium medium]|nr:hypothetical protein [Trifolium medium]